MSDHPPSSPTKGRSGRAASESPRGPSGPRAGFWIRVVATAIDGLILSAAIAPFRLWISEFVGFAVGAVIGLLYYGYLEGGPAGQTVGKRVVNIRVVRAADGGSLGWSTAMLRYACSWLSLIPLWLGYFWMLWDREKQTWHDKLSETVVVPSSAWPAPPGPFGMAPGSDIPL